MKKKLAIVVTHPIQYYAPVFKLLTERAKIEIKVFYTWGEDSIKPKFDPGFGKTIEWDIPLLDGYAYEFLENTSTAPGSSHFKGIINPDVISRINAYQPDALLIYGWSNQSHLKLLRHFGNKLPVWFRGDSNLIDKQTGWKNLLREVFLRWVYSHVDKALYVGSANKEYFKKYGLKEKQLIFAPHAIDNERFSDHKITEVEAFRKNLNIGHDNILITFAGKLEAKKDPCLLLDAFSELKQSKVHLLLVGNGVLEKGLKARVESEKIQNVHFLPFQNQQMMPLVYQSCDLFCLPSKGPGETWGLAVNEAMAAGKPVIVSDKVGCAIDLVKAGRNGFIFRHGDKADLLRKMVQLLTDEKLSIMGRESSKIIRDWSFNQQAGSIETALQRLS